MLWTSIRPLLLAGTVIVTTLLSNVSPLMAETTLNDLKDPLHVQVTTPIHGEATAIGSPFSAVLTETVAYEAQELPSGTVFNGTIEKTTESHMLARPGYVKFSITEVAYPNGHTVDLTDAEQTQKLYHERANTPTRAAKTAWPFAAINAAITLPMRILGLDGGFPIALGAKMALGVTRELTSKDPDDTRNTQQKVGKGMLIGTGLPGAVFIMSKRPEPEMNPGDDLQLFLDPDNMAMVFAGVGADDTLSTHRVKGEIHDSHAQ